MLLKINPFICLINLDFDYASYHFPFIANLKNDQLILKFYSGSLTPNLFFFSHLNNIIIAF